MAITNEREYHYLALPSADKNDSFPYTTCCPISRGDHIFIGKKRWEVLQVNHKTSAKTLTGLSYLIVRPMEAA